MGGSMPKAPNVVDLLERAAQALETSKPAEALDPLRAAWQVVRSRELGDLLDRVSASAGSAGPFPGKTAKARHEAWLALAAQRSPRDIERLLSVLLEGVKSPEAAERLDALASFAPDGRIANALAAIAARPPFQAQTTKPFWKKLFPLLVTHADPRTLDVLGPLADGYVARVGAVAMGTYMKNQLDAALTKIRTDLAAAPPLPDAAESALRQLAAHVPAPSPHALAVAEKTEEDLLAAIAVAPDDDAPRLVYADWLQERGDPRGEYITLQFQRRSGGLSIKEQARETALLTKHKRDWLGPFYRPLQPLWSDVRFERGFLAVVPFCAHLTGVEECAGDARWTTVEELFLPPRPFSFAALFEAPVFGGLRLLRGAAPDVVTTLLRTGVAPRLASLRCAGFDRADGGALAKLSELASLAIDPPAQAPRTRAEDAAWMLELAVMDRLTRFHVTVDPNDAAVAPIFATSNARPDLGLDIRSSASHHQYATLRFSRGPEGRRSKLLLDVAKNPHQTDLVAHYALLLKSIPVDAIQSVHVAGAEKATESALARLLARFQGAALTFG
jgi:uncharacterized protein (TIGR02996 family)